MSRPAAPFATVAVRSEAAVSVTLLSMPHRWIDSVANGFSSGQSVFLALVNALGYGLQGSKVGAVRCWEHLDVIREGGGRLSCGGPFVRSI